MIRSLFLLPFRLLPFVLLTSLLYAEQIGIAHVQKKALGKSIHTNAQITQLSDQKQAIVSTLSAQVKRYYVKAGQSVKAGQRVVALSSRELAKLSSEYMALGQQIKPATTQRNTSKKLYQKGLASKNQLTSHQLALETLRSQRKALATQLQSLGVDASKLSKASGRLILYAHASGVVEKLLIPLHANANPQKPIMRIVQQSGYYASAYLSIDDAMKMRADTRASLRLGSQRYPCRFVQLLPNVDTQTQRAKVLFAIDTHAKPLLIGAMGQIEIFLSASHSQEMVKKSALSLFQGEWVVFVPVEEHDEDGHDDHDEHDDHDDHDKHEKHSKHDDHDEAKAHGKHHEKEAHDEHDDHEAHDEHDAHEEEKHDAHGHGHDAHEEKPAPYRAKVVEIIAYHGEDVAIRGLKSGEEYVSTGVYFVKSMLLKSSLGGHGH